MVAFLAIAYLNRTFFLTYLIKPIAHILWLVYKTFLSIDQEVYWALLILTALIVILLMIPDHREDTYRPAYDNSVPINDRVVYWETLLKLAEESEIDRLVLQFELKALNPSIEAVAEGNDAEDIRLPPYKRDLCQWVWSIWITKILSRILHHKYTPEFTELEQCVDIIVNSMETQLEIDHEKVSNQTNKD
jgi:hypothetical protein